MDKLKKIAEYLAQYDIQMYFVGGFCRDFIMGIKSNDVDVCLVGTNQPEMTAILEDLTLHDAITGFTTVHGNFPIWIVEIGENKYEFALARTERKTGDTHQDFECSTEAVTIEQDLYRRDLTINAIAQNVLTGKFVDPWDGIKHIEAKIATPVSKAFAEDKLRVIRAAKFIARFELRPSISLLQMCGEMKAGDISMERIGKELMKFFKDGGDAFKFFGFLMQVNWLSYYFPELFALMRIPQDAHYHPEGTAYVHTLHTINACKQGDWFTKAVMLCHDLGKATTTTIDKIPFETWIETAPSGELRIQSIGHEEASVPICKEFLKRIHFCSHKEINQIATLVKLHMIGGIINEKNKDKVVRRHLRMLNNNGLEYSNLVEVVRCDMSGRPPLPLRTFENVNQILHGEHAQFLLDTGAMTPVVTGKLLLQHGLIPSFRFNLLIGKALELQDRGVLRKDNWKHVLRGAGFDYKIKQMT